MSIETSPDVAASDVAAPRRVSVIIGTRDRPALLREALASIRALEGPDLTFEILVGDNGADPQTPEIVAAFGGVYDRTDKNGCPAARNLALRRASGEFIAFLDDDDVWTSNHVRPHIALLDAHPEYEAVFAQIQSTDQDLVPTGNPWPHNPPADGDWFHLMTSGYFPQVGGTVTRARALDRYGLMDETLIGDSDWDWQLRIARNHKIGFVEKPCVLFRQRPKGSFDALQWRRSGFTRKIFLRHARAEWRRWPSPASLARAYFKTQESYFEYFTDAAAQRVADGDRKGARAALGRAFAINPFRLALRIARIPPFRGVAARALGLARAPRQETDEAAAPLADARQRARSS